MDNDLKFHAFSSEFIILNRPSEMLDVERTMNSVLVRTDCQTTGIYQKSTSTRTSGGGRLRADGNAKPCKNL
jgi:hypothetical protein